MSKEIKRLNNFTITEENELFFSREGQTNQVTAKVLDKKTDADGKIVSLLLDRMIVREHENELVVNFRDGQQLKALASGCFVTELTF